MHRFTLIIVALIAAGCDEADAPQSNQLANAVPAAPASTPVASTAPEANGSDSEEDKVPEAANAATSAPPRVSSPAAAQDGAARAPARPSALFEHTIHSPPNGSRRIQEAHAAACRHLRQQCRLVASDIRLVGDADVAGEMTYRIARSAAQGFSDRAVAMVRAGNGNVVESRVNDDQAFDSATGRSLPLPETGDVTLRYADPRSGLERGMGMVLRNFAAIAITLLVILGTAAPWILLALFILYVSRRIMRRWNAAAEAAAAARTPGAA